MALKELDEAWLIAVYTESAAAKERPNPYRTPHYHNF